MTIEGSAIPGNGTAQSGGLPPVVNTGSFNPQSLTVDESGDVLVVDVEAKAIDVFTPAGSFVRQIGSAAIGIIEYPNAIALDSSGHLYVSSRTTAHPGLFELDAATGECIQVGCARWTRLPSLESPSTAPKARSSPVG